MNDQAISGHQFAVNRICLGSYLCIHFGVLLSLGPTGFTPKIVIFDAETWSKLASLLDLFSLAAVPGMTTGPLVLAMVLSIILISGWQRRWIALSLAVLWVFLGFAHHIMGNACIILTGLVLCMLVALPAGEPLSRSPRDSRWLMPHWIYWTLMLALMGAYTVSGLQKVGADNWLNGTALIDILDGTPSNDLSLRILVLNSPPYFLKAISWTVMAMEILALPLTLWRHSRPLIWCGLVLLNVLLLMLGEPVIPTIGLLVIHLFVFDRRWLAPAPSTVDHPVVFFDGVCNLCNWAVDFILAEDQSGRFHFAATQSKAAQKIDDHDVKSGESMALQDGKTLYTKSDAVLRVAAGLGGLWRVFSWLRWIPRPIRDAAYFLVQRNRYAVFGRRTLCRLPTSAERARFLD